MTLDEEMKLWNERAHDEFGNILRSIRDLIVDYFPSGGNPIDSFMAEYALDGNRGVVYGKTEYWLESYDILGNDEGVETLMIELKNTL